MESPLTTRYQAQTMLIVHTVIVGLLFLTAFCCCFLSCCFARMRHDPERRGLHFVKAAWVFFFL